MNAAVADCPEVAVANASLPGRLTRTAVEGDEPLDLVGQSNRFPDNPFDKAVLELRAGLTRV